ncbi:MAG: hypothetical protein ABII71_06255 [Candidatus Micrarchaeota archaeon]
MRIMLVLLIVVIALVAGGAYYFLLSPEAAGGQEEVAGTFTAIKMERAGDSGYAVFNHRGPANITLISLDEMPSRKLTIINDTEGMEMGQLAQFVETMKGLEDYGFIVDVTDDKVLGRGIFVVPTGAIPNYVYDDLWYNATNGTVIFIGETDLVIRRGVKKEAWYSSLSPAQKERVVLYELTLDELMDAGNDTVVFQDILESSWLRNSKTNRLFEGSGLKTITTLMDSSEYLRMVYTFPGGMGIIDSAQLPREGKVLVPEPPAVYPWDKATLSFELNKTNGTAFLSVYKDGEGLKKEDLRRVTDDNYFLKRLEFEEPGEYIIEVTDNMGTIASGILHINELEISLAESAGITYVFDVMVDGKPLKSAEVVVSKEGSEMEKEFFISDGRLVLQAQLEEGPNTLNMRLLGTTVPVEVTASGSSILQFYLTYGIPGLFLVLVIFFIARMSRRPTYRVRFSDLASEIRKEVRLTPAEALAAFGDIRQEMHLGRSPITAEEFGIALKRFVTNGAEVTTGNVEELLNRMCQSGKLQGHRGYYQPSGENDVRKNTLLRMAREKLIENGVPFTAKKNKFVTKDYEIGFFGGDFQKKALLIVDDAQEARSIVNSLGERERSMLRIKQSNDMMVFVPINKLGEYL